MELFNSYPIRILLLHLAILYLGSFLSLLPILPILPLRTSHLEVLPHFREAVALFFHDHVNVPLAIHCHRIHLER